MRGTAQMNATAGNQRHPMIQRSPPDSRRLLVLLMIFVRPARTNHHHRALNHHARAPHPIHAPDQVVLKTLRFALSTRRRTALTPFPAPGFIKRRATPDRPGLPPRAGTAARSSDAATYYPAPPAS
ncbi:hypothetical protein KCP71_10485 [Salmonella enterica subsp. enterica]|nr:hypothetical protein KCP71_10485 [Salmonella enterica subsp. enterica]